MSGQISKRLFGWEASGNLLCLSHLFKHQNAVYRKWDNYVLIGAVAGNHFWWATNHNNYCKSYFLNVPLFH